jgi:hypothetical protein
MMQRREFLLAMSAAASALAIGGCKESGSGPGTATPVAEAIPEHLLDALFPHLPGMSHLTWTAVCTVSTCPPHSAPRGVTSA